MRSLDADRNHRVAAFAGQPERSVFKTSQFSCPGTMSLRPDDERTAVAHKAAGFVEQYLPSPSRIEVFSLLHYPVVQGDVERPGGEKNELTRYHPETVGVNRRVVVDDINARFRTPAAVVMKLYRAKKRDSPDQHPPVNPHAPAVHGARRLPEEEKVCSQEEWDQQEGDKRYKGEDRPEIQVKQQFFYHR